MDPLVVVLLMISVLLVLIIIETPIAFALGLSGAIGFTLLRSAELATAQIGASALESVASFGLAVIPMYILLGMLAVYGRLAERLYTLGAAAFRRLPGGLAVGTVGACAGFAAVTGSSVAGGATMGRISIDEMIRHGYDKKMAAGSVAAAGTLGGMIPPSIIMVIYSITTGESTGRMLMAGIVPGVLTALVYMTYIIVRERLRTRRTVEVSAKVATGATSERDWMATTPHTHQEPATAAYGGDPRIALGGHGHKNLPLRGLVEAGLLFTIVIGGIYTGVFTPTESGAVGALAALAIMIFETWQEGFRSVLARLSSSLRESATTSVMIFAILIGSALFTVALVASRVPQSLVQVIVDSGLPAKAVVAIMIALLIPLGMFLESISILVITMPLMYPVVTSLGFNGVWFGVLAVLAIEIGLITPPIGVSCYVVASTSSSVTTEDVFRGAAPFVVFELLVLCLLFQFPDVVLALPRAIE